MSELDDYIASCASLEEELDCAEQERDTLRHAVRAYLRALDAGQSVRDERAVLRGLVG